MKFWVGHEFIVVNYFLVTGNVYILFISDDSQFSELFRCFQEVLEQRDVQPLFVNVIFEEVCVDDLSYFACQPPTVISKFDSHNYCSHITCFLNIYFLIFIFNCIYQYIVLSWMFVWKCRCHQVARAKKVLGLALFYTGNNDEHMAR